MYAQIDFTKTHPDAVTPAQATTGAAGFDLVSVDLTRDGPNYIVNTGLRTAFSPAYVMMVCGRSGYARKHGLHLANGVGIIDSDYRGDIQLMFRCNNGLTDWEIAALLAPGNRVAQALILPMPMVSWVERKYLTDSDRGSGGFGSTGS